MNDPRPRAAEAPTIHWPEPAHLRLEQATGVAEPCEIQFNDGTVERGELLRFTGRDEHLIFRPSAEHPRYPARVALKTSRFKRLRLTNPVTAQPLDASVFGSGGEGSQIQVYNIEFGDHEIESGNTAGFVRTAIGLFLYFAQPGERLERVFVPEAAIAYFQAGDPIGRMLVEEHVVSEEQLKAAVDKQQEMRKLVLGDYLIDEGLITPQQLDRALAHQASKPSLRLGEALIELGAIQSETLQVVLSRQRANRGRPLGQILVDMGVVDNETLTKIQAKKRGRPFVSLANFTPADDAVKVLSGGVARRLGVMPLSIEHGDLIVAVADELDTAAMNELTLLARMRVVQVMASIDEIETRQDQAYGEAPQEIFLADSYGVRFDDDAAPDASGAASTGEQVVDEGAPDAPATRLADVIDAAVRTLETGWTLEVRSEEHAGRRTTHVRLTRGDR